MTVIQAKVLAIFEHVKSQSPTIEPSHTQQVDENPHTPVPPIVMRSPIKPCIMANRYLLDLCTTGGKHRAQKSVPAFKPWQFCNETGFHQSSRATRVSDGLTQKPVSNTVGDLADPLCPAIILAIFTPAQNRITTSFQGNRPKPWNVGRIVLAIGIKRGQPFPDCMACGNRKACGLTTLATVPDQLQSRFIHLKIHDNLTGAVARTIVHHNHFIIRSIWPMV